MKRQKNRLLSLLLSFVMLFGMLPATSGAQAEAEPEWQADYSAAEITACPGHTVGRFNGFCACVNSAGELHYCSSNFPYKSVAKSFYAQFNTTFGADSFATEFNAGLHLSEADALEMDTGIIIEIWNHSYPDFVEGDDRNPTLQGIQYFPNMMRITIDGESCIMPDDNGGYTTRPTFTSLDLRNQPNLRELRINNISVAGIDLSKNTNLEVLEIAYRGNWSGVPVEEYSHLTRLQSLDLSKQTRLQSLRITQQEIPSLDLSMCQELEFLSMYDNSRLTEITFCKHADAALKSAIIVNSDVEALDFSNLAKLESVTAEEMDRMTSIDVAGCPALKKLNVQYNSLESLDLKENPELLDLDCYGNELTTLDVSKNTKLRSLNCGNNHLTSLDLSTQTLPWISADLSLGPQDYDIEKVVDNVVDLHQLPEGFLLSNVVRRVDGDGEDESGQFLCYYSGNSIYNHEFEDIGDDLLLPIESPRYDAVEYSYNVNYPDRTPAQIMVINLRLKSRYYTVTCDTDNAVLRDRNTGEQLDLSEPIQGGSLRFTVDAVQGYGIPDEGVTVYYQAGENDPVKATAYGAADDRYYSITINEPTRITVEGIVEGHTHRWDSGVESTSPTCTRPGVRTYTCSVENCTKTEEIPALGHDWSGWTDNADGATHTRVCLRDGCGEAETAGHQWNSGYTSEWPGCTQPGEKTYRCTVTGCNATRTEELPATGHDMYEYAPETENTCTRCGNLEYWWCGNCDGYFGVEDGSVELDREQVFTHATGHDYQNGACEHCGRTVPVYVKVTSEEQLGQPGTYIIVSTDGTNTYVLKEPFNIWADMNNNNQPDIYEIDADGNGEPDLYEGGIDTDADGVPDITNEIFNYDYAEPLALPVEVNADGSICVAGKGAAEFEMIPFDLNGDQDIMPVNDIIAEEGGEEGQGTNSDLQYLFWMPNGLLNGQNKPNTVFSCYINGGEIRWADETSCWGVSFGNALSEMEQQELADANFVIHDDTAILYAENCSSDAERPLRLRLYDGAFNFITEYDEWLPGVTQKLDEDGNVVTDEYGYPLYDTNDQQYGVYLYYAEEDGTSGAGHGHVWDGGTQTTAPTCTQEGAVTYTCTVEDCGQTKVETVDALGHDWSDWACSSAGEHARECRREGCGLSEVCAHDWSVWEPVDETTHRRICSVCGGEQTGTHRYESTVVREPNCTVSGLMTQTCSLCEDHREITMPIDPNAHDWEEWTLISRPDVGAAGEERRVCRHNGQHTQSRTMDPLPCWHACTACGGCTDDSCPGGPKCGCTGEPVKLPCVELEDEAISFTSGTLVVPAGQTVAIVANQVMLPSAGNSAAQPVTSVNPYEEFILNNAEGMRVETVFEIALVVEETGAEYTLQEGESVQVRLFVGAENARAIEEGQMFLVHITDEGSITYGSEEIEAEMDGEDHTGYILFVTDSFSPFVLVSLPDGLEITCNGTGTAEGCAVSIHANQAYQCKLVLAAYDSSGKALAIRIVDSCNLAANPQYTLEFSGTASCIKAFIMEAGEGFAPRCIAAEDGDLSN